MAQRAEEVAIRIGPQIMTPAGTLLLTLDAALTQQHTLAAAVTKHPVEDGAEVADHVQPQARRLSLSGIISATPLWEEGYDGRELDGWQVLAELIGAGEPVDIYTSLDVYRSMVLISVVTVRDPETGRAIMPAIEAEEVRRVKLQTTVLPAEVRKPRQKASAPKRQDVGKQPTDVPTAAQTTATNRSMLVRLLDMLSGPPTPAPVP